jgi:hypothetical protein
MDCGSLYHTAGSASALRSSSRPSLDRGQRLRPGGLFESDLRWEDGRSIENRRCISPQDGRRSLRVPAGFAVIVRIVASEKARLQVLGRF